MSKNPLEAFELLKAFKLLRLVELGSLGTVDRWVLPILILPLAFVAVLCGFRRRMALSGAELRLETVWFKWVLRSRVIGLDSITACGPMKFMENPPWYVELHGSNDRIWLPHHPTRVDESEMNTIRGIQEYLKAKQRKHDVA